MLLKEISTSTAALIDYKAYQDLVKLYYESLKSEGGANVDDSDYITMLKGLLGTDLDIGEGKSKEDLKNAVATQKTKKEQDATELLYGKLNALIGNMPAELQEYSVDPLLAGQVDWVEKPEDAVKEYFSGEKPKVVSMGKSYDEFHRPLFGNVRSV